MHDEAPPIAPIDEPLHPAIFDIVAVLKRLPFVEGVLLFGSRARGDHQLRSDIDLAIDCPSATVQQWQQVLTIIENAKTLLPIDCVRLDEADIGLRSNILAHQCLLYLKENYE